MDCRDGYDEIIICKRFNLFNIISIMRKIIKTKNTPFTQEKCFIDLQKNGSTGICVKIVSCSGAAA